MYEKINKYSTSPILQRLAGEIPWEHNVLNIHDLKAAFPDIKIGQQPADQLPWFVRALPEPLDISLPSVEEIEAELSGGKDE